MPMEGQDPKTLFNMLFRTLSHQPRWKSQKPLIFKLPYFANILYKVLAQCAVVTVPLYTKLLSTSQPILAHNPSI